MQNTVWMPTKTKWKSSFAMLVARPNFHFQIHSLFLSQFKNNGRVYCAESGSLFNPSVSKMAHNDWAHLVSRRAEPWPH